MNQEQVNRKLSCILSTDVVGYSRLMEENEASTVRYLEENKRLISNLIEEYNGRVVDSPGDNLLAEFNSAVKAVDCAVKIQKELKIKNAELVDNRRMQFRIGINLGDVIEEDGRLYGSGVNIAARLESLADPGGICISRKVYDEVKTKLDLGYEYLGEHSVKNISEPVRVYRVQTGIVTAGNIVDKKVNEGLFRIRNIAVALIIIVAGLLVWWFYPSDHIKVEPASIERMAFPLPDKPSIAVLPFTNMSGDPAQDYIGDGLSENIISALSVSSEMFVMSRSATFMYKGKSVKPQQVAEDLGIKYVLEGSFMTSGDRLRVTAQLIDALGGYYLWSEVYNRETNDLFELQDEITKKIAVSINVELYGREAIRVFSKSTENLEAWKNFIKGGELTLKENPEDNTKAREYFKAALKLDPEYVGAMTGLAVTHLIDIGKGWSASPLTSMNRAFELVQKAVELDGQDPYPHAVLGLAFLYQRKHEKAITEGNIAITLNPNFSLGQHILAKTMCYSGRFDEAVALSKKGIRLQPNGAKISLRDLTRSYIFLGHYGEALEICRQMEESAEKAYLSSWVYQELGKEEEAHAYMVEALKKNPDLSLESIKASSPYKDPSHLKRELNAYRKAGMPERVPGTVQEKPSIAVLPFKNISPDKDQDYFVDGLSEEILNSLTQIPDLTVIAKTSSFSFKGKDKTIQEIASVLGVNHILEGSVRKAGNAIRITSQLIQAVDGSHLWSKTYDKELNVKEMFAVQEDIAAAVADELKLTLGISDTLKQLGGTDNLEAYELYLIAQGQLKQAGDDLMTDNEYIAHYEATMKVIDTAITIDPDYALAWILKASIHMELAANSPPERVAPEQDAALQAIQKAIEIEPSLADAYAVLGAYKTQKGDLLGAESANIKAFELTYKPWSLGWKIGLQYLTVGHLERANEILEAVKRNDPFHETNRQIYIISLGCLGDMQGAEKEYKRCMTLFGEPWNNGNWTISFLRLSKDKIVSADDIPHSNLIFDTLKSHIKSQEDALAQFHEIYTDNDNLTTGNFADMSVVVAYLGDLDFSMDAMEKAYSIDNSRTSFIWLPVMREVRQISRFKKFVKEIGLVDYWKEYGWPDLCHEVGDDDFVCD